METPKDKGIGELILTSPARLGEQIANFFKEVVPAYQKLDTAKQGLMSSNVLRPGEELKMPEIKIDPNSNNVKVDGADFTKTNTFLDMIAQNTKVPVITPAPVVNITIDKKFLQDSGWNKIGG